MSNRTLRINREPGIIPAGNLATGRCQIGI